MLYILYMMVYDDIDFFFKQSLFLEIDSLTTLKK